jgi:hypothetical protein
MTGCLAVVGVVLVIAASAYSGLSSSDVQDALAERTTPVPASESYPDPSLTPISLSPTPTNTPASTATRVSNRLDCAQIRGTEYYSPEERTWYLANCVRR